MFQIYKNYLSFNIVVYSLRSWHISKTCCTMPRQV